MKVDFVEDENGDKPQVLRIKKVSGAEEKG